jgi:hypothetical protein
MDICIMETLNVVWLLYRNHEAWKEYRFAFAEYLLVARSASTACKVSVLLQGYVAAISYFVINSLCITLQLDSWSWISLLCLFMICTAICKAILFLALRPSLCIVLSRTLVNKYPNTSAKKSHAKLINKLNH